MFVHVVEARHLHDYVVWLRFKDGAEGEVDLASELDGPVFEPLKGLDYFKSFSIACHTLAWDNGADFAPEFLRERLHAVARS